MRLFLVVLLFFAVTVGLLVSGTIGVGFALRWLIPDVEIGSALIVGVISSLGALHYLLKLLSIATSAADYEALDEEDDILMRVPPHILRRRNRRKRERGR